MSPRHGGQPAPWWLIVLPGGLIALGIIEAIRRRRMAHSD